MARLLPATDASIAEAADRLRRHEPVALPTETVYGLGAGTFDVAGLDRVFAMKGRPDDNPLIAHVRDADDARRVVERWDDRADRLAAAFWPGPLTIVLARAAAVPDRATAGWPTIAVRAPSHPVAIALIEAYGGPISAPSANRSGHVSPTRAEHVMRDFADIDLLVLDGGPCAIGLESTVVDLSCETPRVLRPGAVSIDDLQRRLGAVEVARIAEQVASPGTAGRHYAPSRPAELVSPASLPARLRAGDEACVVIGTSGVEVTDPHRLIEVPATPEGYAACLYDALREADASDADRILVVEPQGRDGLWLAVWDRLLRATV